VQRNKTDAADAQAIWTACQQPGMRFVPVKTEAQQIVLSLQRLRAQLMKTRIMQTNELRGLLYEFGIVLPEGHAALLKALPDAMCDAKTRLPAMLADSLNGSGESGNCRPTSVSSSDGSRSRCEKYRHARPSPKSPALVFLRRRPWSPAWACRRHSRMLGSLPHGSDWFHAPNWHGWAGETARHQQTWRCLPANAADARCPSRRDQIKGQLDMAMGCSIVAAPTL
jgi:hypothetical protein